MKTDKLRESSNVEDRRGQSSYSSSGSGLSSGLGGGLLQILFSGGNWKTKILLLFLLFVMGGGASLSGMFGSQSASYQSNQVTTQKSTSVSDKDAEFVSKVLGSTEDHWTQMFQQEGLSYPKPTLVFYTGRTQTGCGIGQAAAGPFYCPNDQKVYLDVSFYQELSTKYKAKGDFAMAYVIAHEVGHHIQNTRGTIASYNRQRRGLSEKEQNALNVRLELQADYYAGVWARYVDEQGLMDAGDIEEAMTAAHAVGDDTLQKDAYGYTVPDSFTHGTSEQRQRWFERGYKYGDFDHGDTFSIAQSAL